MRETNPGAVFGHPVFKTERLTFDILVRNYQEARDSMIAPKHVEIGGCALRTVPPDGVMQYVVILDVHLTVRIDHELPINFSAPDEISRPANPGIDDEVFHVQ